MPDWLDRAHEAKLEAYRRLADEACGSAGASFVGWRPLASDALAVHPALVVKAVSDARARGVPTDFTGDGRPVFTSRAHRKAYCLAYGFVDRDAGYSDAAPGSTRRFRERREVSDKELRAQYDF